MLFQNLRYRTILCLLLVVFASDGFSADGNNPGKNSDTGLVSCLQDCETVYSKCGGSWLCDLQAAKCSIKCAVAKTEGSTDSGSIIVTIQQKSTMRYLDAHESADKDYRLVTRAKQNNKTQHWKLTSHGNDIFTLNQESNGRFADAHEYSKKDFGLVTRTKQNNDTQLWIIRGVADGLFTIRQKSNGRYVDAHVTKNRDYEVVTRTFQDNNTQRWLIKPVSKIDFTKIKNNLKSQEFILVK